MQRYALTFRIKPGTEEAVESLLASYEPPRPEVDEDTRLVSTSVFMKGGLVVRVIEFEGSFPKVIAHLSKEPTVQRVEQELDRYLVDEDRRDMSHPEGAREFFKRALMKTVTTRTTNGHGPAET